MSADHAPECGYHLDQYPRECTCAPLRPELTDEQRLQNLADAMADDIMAMTDAELRQELIEDGQDPDQISTDMRALIARTIAEHNRRKA